MKLMALVIALALEQWRPLRSGNNAHVAFARLVNKIAVGFNAGQYRDGVISWVLAVVPLALITILVEWALRASHGLLALAWSVAVLYLVLGFRQFSHYYNEVWGALKLGDLARARLALAAWRGGSVGELSANELARVAIEQGLLRSHRHVFAVIAWFALLGPAGAIVYRLAALLSDRWAAEGAADPGVFGAFAARAFLVMDWLPVRLTAIGFAVAGDFMGAVEAWREQAATWRSKAQGIILASAAGALGCRLGGVLHEQDGIEYRPQLGEGDEVDVDYMEAATGLIWRSLVLWLFLILLVTIASWF